MASVFAAYDGIEQRTEARAPVIVWGKAEKSATGWWRETFDKLNDQEQHDVIYIEPLTDDAPLLPPGLPRWPEPGEVFLSPGLLAAGKAEASSHVTARSPD